MNNKPYYYGQGRLYLSKIKPDGTPVNLLWLGDCSDLTLNIASEIKVKKTSLGGRRLDAGLSVTDTTASLAFTLYEHSQENLARALWGNSTSSISGYITGQAIPDGIKPGERFIICDASIWGVTIPGLESGIDFKVDPFFGAIEFITQPPAGVTVSYYHSRCAQVTLLSTIPDDLYLRYEGINNASPEMLVTLDVYRVKLSPVDVFNLINNDSSISSIPINARIMPDLSRYTGQDFDLYGRMGTSRRFDGILTLNIHEEQVSGTVSMDGAISLNYNTSLANHTVLITATSKTNRVYTTTAQTDSAGRYVASINLPYGFYSIVAECVLVTPFNNSLTLISESYVVEVPGPVVEFIMRIDSLTRPLFYARKDEEITIDYGDGVDSSDFRIDDNIDIFSWYYTTRELTIGEEYRIIVRGSSTLRFASSATGGTTNSLMELIKVSGEREGMNSFAAVRTTLHTIHDGCFDLPFSTSFVSAFQNCTGLRKIPADLLKKCPSINNARHMFSGCTGLTNVPDGLFEGCKYITIFQNVFYNCSSLTSVSDNAFKGCESAIDFSYAFYQCSALVNIGSGILSGCNSAGNFDFCFYGCKSLLEIPADLFSETINAQSFAQCFWGCVSLSGIPATLFSKCINALSFNGTYYGCTKLLAVPDRLFFGLSKVTTFQNVFSGCIALEKVGRGVFAGCSAATHFSTTFSNCRLLISVGIDIFAGCESVTTFSSAFYNCWSLVSMPDFSDCEKVTNFSNVFYSCRSLVEIPDYAFANKTLATTFYYAFFGCTSLVRVGNGAFKNCISLTNLSYAFQGASMLTTLYGDIFHGCEKVSDVTFLFYQCISLKVIPEHIFDSFSSVTNMNGTFRDCTGIISIPDGLLNYCTSLTSLNATFANCSSLKAIPEQLLGKTEFITSLPSTFAGCSSVSVLPEKLLNNLVRLVSLSSTFAQCTSVTAIPEKLLVNLPLLTDVGGAFNGLSISFIPDELFYENPLITSFGSTFRDCLSLLTISNKVFSKSVNAEMFNYAFYNCIALQFIEIGAFDNTSCRGIGYMLSNCRSLQTGLEEIFPKSVYSLITNTTHAFSYSSISGRGLQFIDKVSNIANHYYTFAECYNLIDYEQIPSNWTGNK